MQALEAQGKIFLILFFRFN